jgi:hypothetical protein
MFLKIIRFILSILLIPACAAFTISFYKGIILVKNVSETGLIFILGLLAYCVIHLLFFKLDFLYVLGHELMHAVATLFSGGKVSHIKVSAKEGQVGTTTPNIFVILAPYLIPGYTVLLALAYFLLSFFIKVNNWSGYFIFFIGFTLMFHVVYTAQSIREKQSDLMKTGYLFSISSIYIVNIVIIFAVLSVLFGEISFVKFLSGSLAKSKDFYYSFWKHLFL